MPNVKQDPNKPPIGKEVLAESITRISDAVDRLLSSGLNRRAVIALLHDKTKVRKSEIETILDGLESLKKDYCR